MPEPELGEEISSDALGPGYNQTYVIRALDPEKGGESRSLQPQRREVLFKCGNWCYEGFVDLSESLEGVDSIPYIIPELQRQQGRLGFYCSASNVPEDSVYAEPLAFIQRASDFVASELASERIGSEIEKWAQVFSWMDDDDNNEGGNNKTYFELVTEAPDYMSVIGAAATKTYARGLIVILIYFQGTFYVVMEDGEGDQPLLDIRFPDVSQHGQGLHIASYPDPTQPWRKLTLWQSLAKDLSPMGKVPVREATVADLSTSDYMQTYIVLRPRDKDKPEALRDVMFRFGSWCYSGKVQLTPTIGLVDIPHVIPVLRMQQSQLDFTCDVTAVPRRSPFFGPMEKMIKLGPIMEEEVISSEAVLANLVKRLSLMGFGDNISEWLDGVGGDTNGSFFEFQTAAVPPETGEDPCFRHIDVMACKNYNPQGIVTITIYFRGTFYVMVSDGATEQPLLDSRFPNVSEKGRGYHLKSYGPEGSEGWRELRKVSIWQTQASLKAQMDRAECKLQDVKAAKGEDAMEAAMLANQRMEQLTQEALRSSPSTEAEDKTPSSNSTSRTITVTARAAGGGSSRSSISSKQLDPVVLLGGGQGYRSSPLSAVASPKTPLPSSAAQATTATTSSKAGGADNQQERRQEQEQEGGGEEGDDVLRKTAGFSAAKSLGMNTKVALPHHLEPLHVGGALKDRMKQLQSEMSGGAGGGEAPWDARGKPLLGLGNPFKK